MRHYSGTYAYQSQFEPTRLFATIEEVRSFDRSHAATALAKISALDVDRAFEGENVVKLRKLLSFLNEELPFTDISAA